MRRWGDRVIEIHPPTQETTPACRNTWLHGVFCRRQALLRAGTALAVDECVTPDGDAPAIPLARSGGFRCRADDPTKPWCLQTELFKCPLA